jgi:UrcA family protein
VKVADINTLSPEGARAYAERVDAAAGEFCAKANPTARLTERAHCLEAVRAEMSDKFEARNTALAARQGMAKVASK